MKPGQRNRPRSGKVVPCEHCGTSFYVGPSRVTKNSFHTCSRVCRGKVLSKRHSQKIQVPCEICEKPIWYKQSHFKQITRHTCSSVCRGIIIQRKRLYHGDNNPKALRLSAEDRVFHDRWYDYKGRSSAKSLPFNLTPEFLKGLFHSQAGNCFYTWLPMKLVGVSGRRVDYNIASLDRIEPSKGYVKGNVVFCLNCINMLKSDHSVGDISKVFQAIVKKSHMTNSQKAIGFEFEEVEELNG